MLLNFKLIVLLFPIFLLSKSIDKNKEKIFYNGLEYMMVKSPYTNKIWLDRNLGASDICVSRFYKECHGDYFQWGRNNDGHEKKNSNIVSKSSSLDIPKHNKFINNFYAHSDWLKNQNNNLWQGLNGKNNPCPNGFRIPTIDELLAETTKQGIKNKKDALEKSFLKLPAAGFRNDINGAIYYKGVQGYIWSSTVDGKYSYYLHINSSYVSSRSNYRAYGFSVRCIKD